jgi:hypothetical protein
LLLPTELTETIEANFMRKQFHATLLSKALEEILGERDRIREI